jgi:hypothetical protein
MSWHYKSDITRAKYLEDPKETLTVLAGFVIGTLVLIGVEHLIGMDSPKPLNSSIMNQKIKTDRDTTGQNKQNRDQEKGKDSAKVKAKPQTDIFRGSQNYKLAIHCMKLKNAGSHLCTQAVQYRLRPKIPI